MANMPMQTPQDLFVHEQQGLQKHQRESEQQAQNVERVLRHLGAQPHAVVCHAAEGLRRSLMEVVQSQPALEVLEGAVVAGAVKTEHLEIAAYTGLVEKARAMGQTEAVRLLEENLHQEQAMLRQVEQIGQQLTQRMAGTADTAGSSVGASTAN
jgi:ferritin-like metal-binding protein YciE